MSEPIDSSKLHVPIKTMTLEEFVDKAKLVLDDGIEKEYCTAEALKPIHDHSDYREYTVVLNTARINSASVKQKRLKAMFPMEGINLGSRDLVMKKYNYDITRVTGQRNLILRTDAPKIVEPTVWGHGPGDRGEKVLIPFWAECQFMAIETTFPRADGTQGKGSEITYLQGSTPIGRTKLYELLTQHAHTIDQLEESDFKYQPVVIRGKIGTFGKLTKWSDTGKMVQAKDEAGNPAFLPNGQPKMERERARDEEGFPCIQGRIDNPEEEIYTFTVTVGVLDRDVETKHVVKFKFLNKKIARHFLELNSQQRIFRDAFTRGVGTANDAFDHLTSTYRGTEVFAIGVLTRWDDQGNTVWIDVEGTMLLALNMSGAELAPVTESPLLTTPSPQATEKQAAPTVPAVPTAPAAPEVVAETVDAPVVPEVPAPSSVPVVEPVKSVLVTETVLPPPMAKEEQPLVDRLTSAIKETMEMYGKGKMTFEEFEDFGLCPVELVGAGNKIKKERADMVKKRIAKVRADLGDSEVGSYGDASAPTSVDTQTPEEAARTEVQTECSACGKPMLPTPQGHWEVCDENPKNKEKAASQ